MRCLMAIDSSPVVIDALLDGDRFLAHGDS
jgi:hypothetical protein